MWLILLLHEYYGDKVEIILKDTKRMIYVRPVESKKS